MSDLERFAWAEDFDESHADDDTEPNDTTTSDSPDDQSNGEEAQTPDELQPPINNKNLCNLRSRKTNHELFAAYAAFRDTFDTESDPTLSALATAANRPDNHHVSLFLPEPTTFHAVLRQPPEIMKTWLLALPNPPTVVMVDNEAACKMSLNDKLTKHTRHMSRRFHYVRQGSKMKLHVINWCPGEDMLSDIMTKSTEPSKTTPHRDRAYYKMPKFLEQ